MIIPTGEFDPLFSDDGLSFREKMVEYIRREFPDQLMPWITQLHTDQGLEQLSESIRNPPAGNGGQKAAA